MSGVKPGGFFILGFSVMHFCQFAIMLRFFLFYALLVVYLEFIDFGLHFVDLCLFLVEHEYKLVSKDLFKIDSAIGFFKSHKDHT